MYKQARRKQSRLLFWKSPQRIYGILTSTCSCKNGRWVIHFVKNGHIVHIFGFIEGLPSFRREKNNGCKWQICQMQADCLRLANRSVTGRASGSDDDFKPIKGAASKRKPTEKKEKLKDTGVKARAAKSSVPKRKTTQKRSWMMMMTKAKICIWKPHLPKPNPILGRKR